MLKLEYQLSRHRILNGKVRKFNFPTKLCKNLFVLQVLWHPYCIQCAKPPFGHLIFGQPFNNPAVIKMH